MVAPETLTTLIHCWRVTSIYSANPLEPITTIGRNHTAIPIVKQATPQLIGLIGTRLTLRQKKIDPNKNPVVKEEGVIIQDASGKDRLEIIDIIKPEPMKSPKNTVQWTEEKVAKLMKIANEKKRKNALQINKIVGTQ